MKKMGKNLALDRIAQQFSRVALSYGENADRNFCVLHHKNGDIEVCRVGASSYSEAH